MDLDQIAKICWITRKTREFQKNTYPCFIDYAKVFDCVDHNELWKILKEMAIAEHLLRASQEAMLEQDMGQCNGLVKIRKGV